MAKQDQILLFFIGMARGGSHAMMQWIRDQFKKMKHYDNQIPVLAKSGVRKSKQQSMLSEKRALVKLKYTPLNMSDRFTRSCKRRYGTLYKTILGIRDPLNWLSSFLKHHHGQNISRTDLHREVNKFAQFYKSIMMEFLDINNVVSNKVTFNYNKWASDVEYRHMKSIELGGDRFSDDMINVVAQDPGVRGSSFDGSKYQGRAHEMNIFTRYEYLLSGDKFGVFKYIDDELINMAAQIFEGTPIYDNKDDLNAFVTKMRKQ